MATTIRRIYELALARVMESPGNDEDYDNYSPALLDTLFMEALPYENQIRKHKGLPTLDTAPEVRQIDETVLDWDDRITRIALPYGLSAVILADDESRKAESVLARNEFVTALETAAPGIEDSAEGW